ncbi:HDIG domain-containing protein [Dehalogenimonas formicexedens]|uniref:HDIG domain-containing protein n=2 Tax=Dehalogenimonas formicexedens TaxID=1839801 RepID=A0A1P8F5U2_9CHLR|nr:HDIG domain-containing protein [Dehalogenimonas formicexedens]
MNSVVIPTETVESLSKRMSSENVVENSAKRGCSGCLLSGDRCSNRTTKMDAQAILDAMPAYALLIDSTHHIVGANKAFYQAMNLDLPDVIGAYCPKLVHGLNHPFHGCPLEEAVAMGGLESVERELFDPARRHWIKTAVYPTGQFTEDGHPIFLHTAEDITAQKLTAKRLTKEQKLQHAISEILRLSLKDISLDDILKKALNIILAAPQIGLEKKGCIFLVEDDRETLVMKVQVGLEEPVKQSCARVGFGTCLCGQAALTQSIQYSTTLDERHSITYPGISDHGHTCLPLVSGGRTLGVINTYLKKGRRRDSEGKKFLITAANVLSGVLVRRQAEMELKASIGRLQRTFKQTILTISKISEEIDQYTAGHQKRVAQMARAIAQEMGLDPDRVEGIEVAGLVHDIGKVAVPASILSKPGRLNEFEMGLVRTHSETGYDILKEVDFPWPIAQIVRQHHERLNNSGYPDKIPGESMLMEAKILAVADVFEAMSSHRPYRPGLGVSAALNELLQKKGTFFDSEVVDTCLKLVVEKGFKFN